jgi:putative methyltransferase (TIGR04325 family)
MLKKILKLFIPPIFLNFKNLLFIIKQPNNITWSGIYSKTSDIPKSIKIMEYVSDEDNQIEFEKFKNSTFDLDFRPSILPLFICNLQIDNISILDIGGGYKSVYHYIIKSTYKKVNVTVLERQNITDTLKNANYKFNYISDLDELNQINVTPNFHIVYFGSSIQYFHNYQDFLNKIFAFKPLYIIIADSIFTEKIDSFIALQINMHPSIIPSIFINIKSIENLLNINNYELIYKSKRKPTIHDTLQLGEYFTRDLIFKKII